MLGVLTALSLRVAKTSSVEGVLITPKVLTSGVGCVESRSNDSDNKQRKICPKGAHSRGWSELVEFAGYSRSQGTGERHGSNHGGDLYRLFRRIVAIGSTHTQTMI